MRRFFQWAAPALLVALLPTWAFGSDVETARKIAESLRGSGRLHDYSIGVNFEDGKAQLLGRVSSDEQAQLAVEMAEQLPYVTAVENKLEIKPSAKRDEAVQPVAHQESARRVTVSRDAALFGESTRAAAPTIEQVSAEQPVPPAVPAPAPAARRSVPHGAQPVGRQMNYTTSNMCQTGSPIPVGVAPSSVNQRVAYDQPHMPCYSWPSYAAHPNYAAVTYPNQYAASAWPYIGPFYPYPQVPLGWRRVTMEWKDGWWWLDFNDHSRTFRR